MGIISSSKSTGGTAAIPCQGTFHVTLGITANLRITINPG